MKRKKKIYDAFPTATGARQFAGQLNRSSLTSASNKAACPHGPGAVVRKLKPAQDGGRLKYGVYVNVSCKVY